MEFLKKGSLATGLLILRVLMGIGIAIHGWQKIFGGGITGFAGFLEGMGIPLPTLSAWLAALTELLGGVLIALGLGTRVAALLLFFSMSVAVFKAHAADPFAKKELALAYWTMAGALFFTGPGLFSIDAILGWTMDRKNQQIEEAKQQISNTQQQLETAQKDIEASKMV